MCQSEHLNLAELMQAVETLGVLPFASLFPEAVAEGDHFVS